jgi:tetratricopeptide (TPR) repeat protein
MAVEGTQSERALALNNLGVIAFRAGEDDSAGGFWKRSLAEEPNYPTVLGNLATLCNRKGEHREALQYLRRATALNPSNGPTLNNLAYQLALLGENLDEAETLSRRAVSLDPDWNHRDTLGYVLLRRNRWEKAEEVLSSVVKEHPEAYETQLHLGMAQAGLGRPEQARSTFRSLIEKSPSQELVRQAEEELRKL